MLEGEWGEKVAALMLEAVQRWVYRRQSDFEGPVDSKRCRARVWRPGAYRPTQCTRQPVETVAALGACRQHAAKLIASIDRAKSAGAPREGETA